MKSIWHEPFSLEDLNYEASELWLNNEMHYAVGLEISAIPSFSNII